MKTIDWPPIIWWPWHFTIFIFIAIDSSSMKTQIMHFVARFIFKYRSNMDIIKNLVAILKNGPQGQLGHLKSDPKEFFCYLAHKQLKKSMGSLLSQNSRWNQSCIWVIHKCVQYFRGSMWFRVFTRLLLINMHICHWYWYNNNNANL